MQKIFKKLFGLAIIGAMITFMACEGPEGPEGPQGPAGEDGKSAAIDCMDCHNSSTLLKAKMMQYEESMHYMGTSYVRGSSGSCAPCHSNEGFNVLVESGPDAVEGVDEPTPPACRTCHNIHEEYALEDYALKGTDPYNLMGDMTDNAEVDMGKGNMCGKCHQTRDRGYFVEGETGDINISSSHWGPHHGPQTNVLVGKGGINVGDAGDYSNTEHTHGTSGALADGCVSCHASGNANHTFEAQLATCDGCHSGIEDFDLAGFQTATYDLLMELEEALVADGLLEVEHEGEMGHPINGQTVARDKAAALFNYFVIYEDGSLGIHNPRYVKALLENSIAVFN